MVSDQGGIAYRLKTPFLGRLLKNILTTDEPLAKPRHSGMFLAGIHFLDL
jgi:hypothetical protein